jgi:arsenite methyltransferase
MTTDSQDRWANWLLHRRHGGDPVQHQAVLDYLAPIRDDVLRNACLAPGDILLDVGTGDGLIAFAALDQLGDHGTVIFSDISEDLLTQCRMLAEQSGVRDRCHFLRMAADQLADLADTSVDVITTRSVLIYVAAKQQAFTEFYRVLKPQGRLSIFEPINRFGYPEPSNQFMGYDVTPIQSLAEKVRAVYEQAIPPDTHPMLDFDERDLLAFAEQAGFADIHLELHAAITPATSMPPWEILLHVAGNPLEPTLAEAIQRALTPAEAAQFTAHLRPLIELSKGIHRSAVAYLWATKT